MALRPPPLRPCSLPHLLDARPPGPSLPVRPRDRHESSGSRISRCAARLPFPPVSGGSGGSRTSLQRAPPFPYLDADQRVRASSRQIIYFAELPVLLDDHSLKGNSCEDCGSPQLLSNTPHFFTIDLDLLSSSESQDTLSHVLAGITSPVDTGFFRKSADSSTMYTATSMELTDGSRNCCCSCGTFGLL